MWTRDKITVELNVKCDVLVSYFLGLKGTFLDRPTITEFRVDLKKRNACRYFKCEKTNLGATTRNMLNIRVGTVLMSRYAL